MIWYNTCFALENWEASCQFDLAYNLFQTELIWEKWDKYWHASYVRETGKIRNRHIMQEIRAWDQRTKKKIRTRTKAIRNLTKKAASEENPRTTVYSTRKISGNKILKKKLEICCRAQREATRRCASDWGHNLAESRVKISLVAKPSVPNAVTLAYTARAVLIVGGSTFASIRRREERRGKGREGQGRGREYMLSLCRYIMW